jgi:sugar phosphate isomerase/epimerase
MHLGVCHHVTLPGEWDQAIADAGALGFEGIELFVRSNTKADLLDRPERVASLRAAADRAGINFPSLGLVFYGPNFRLYELDLDARAKAVQQTRVGIERCAELGSRVVLVPGAPPLSDQPAVEAYVGSIKDLATTAATLGVKLGIETGYNSPETKEILGQIGSPWVGDYFDTGNAAGQGRDPVEDIRQRKGLIVQIHIKGTRGADLAAGTVDLSAVKRALQDTGYDDWLMLETSAGDAPLDAARRNYATMRESLL